MASENISLEERQKRLSTVSSSKTMQGWNVIDRSDQECYVILALPGKKVNHVLHLIVSLVTCVWLVVWAVMVGTRQKEQRIRITIDTFGNMQEEAIQLDS